MTIHEFQKKVKDYDVRKDFKTLYQSCMTAIESLSESELLSLLDSSKYGPAGYINCFQLWSNKKKIIICSSNGDDDVVTDVSPDHKRLYCINSLSISVAYEKNPKIIFSGCISVGLIKKYPNCIFATGNVKEILKNIFGDCLVSVSFESDYESLQEVITEDQEEELIFQFEVLEDWFLN